MFNWEDFIYLADELYTISNTTNDISKKEALYRTITSRAYYGIFKQVEDHLGTLGINPKSHEKIISYFLKNSDSHLKRFGTLLNELKKRRQDADYKASVKISEEDLKKILWRSCRLNRFWNDTIKTLLSKNPQPLW